LGFLGAHSFPELGLQNTQSAVYIG